MPCGWEGNRWSGVAQAMRHGLQWSIHLRAHGLRKGEEHPAYIHSSRSMALLFTFFVNNTCMVIVCKHDVVHGTGCT